MSGIVGMNGQPLQPQPEAEAMINIDYFVPSEKASDPRVQALGALAQGMIQLSMQAEIGEFVIRFKNRSIGAGIVSASQGTADLKFIASDDPTYRAFAEMELPAPPDEAEFEELTEEKQEEGEDA